MMRLLIAAVVFFCIGSGQLQAQEKIIYTLVALCDNDYQGIVPVPARIGNGDDPHLNLYWGCGYGVRTHFKRSTEWELVQTTKNPKQYVLERCIFRNKAQNAIMVADAYRGRNIKECTEDFLKFSSGNGTEVVKYKIGETQKQLNLHGASLINYVGHNGLMDFDLESYPAKKGEQKKETIILACISKSYFKEPIKKAGASPLLWTTGLMAPEAYTLKAAINGWLKGESNEQVRMRAAEAYNKYQKCGLNGAKRLFSCGW